MKIIKVLYFYFLSLSIIYSQPEKADFFITQSPAKFEILNQYQQKLSFEKLSELLPNTPWQIVKESTLLSDNYTKAMHVKFKGQSFYFGLNEDGSFISSALDHQNKIFKNCRLQIETVMINMDEAVLFREVPFSSNRSGYPRTYLDQNVIFQKIFKKGSSYFVKDISQNRFGWVRINNTSAISSVKKKEEKLDSKYADILKNQVDQKAVEINLIYLQLYSLLNKKYSQKKIAPRWDITTSQNEIQLNLISENPEKEKNSKAYFVNDLENLIIGQPVEINSSSQQITLKLISDE